MEDCIRYSFTQGVNCLLLVQIVSGACFQRHHLVAVFGASWSIFQMTFDSSQTNRMGRDNNFDGVELHICETSRKWLCF